MILNFKPTLNNDKSNSTQPIGVNLKIDEKCFILYWRDANFKVILKN